MFTVLPSLSIASESAPQRPANIILLLADDLGWTGLGCFGSDLYETPNLDAMAQRGVKFTNAYSACTVCSPTRASIMTGKSPARLHLTDFIAGQNRPFAKLKIPDWTKRLSGHEVTIAELLKQKGYRTGHVGKWHLSGQGTEINGTRPIDQGFDYSYERPQDSKGYLLKEQSDGESKPAYLTDVLTDRACEFIDASKEDPFFLYFAYNVPHTPIQGRKDLVNSFQKKIDSKSTDQKLLHDNAHYAAMVASLDQSVGRVLACLESNAISDNTVVLFFSDNGGLTQRNGKHDRFTENLPLRRGKGSAYEGGVRVPAIAYWPNVTTPQTVCDEPVITTDLFWTLCDIAGVDVDDTKLRDGQTLVPLLKNVAETYDRDLFWHYPHYHAGGDGPYSAIRSGNYRLIKFYEDQSCRLYDLDQDIAEQVDLSGKRPKLCSKLQGKLEAWLQSTGAQVPTENSRYDPARETLVVRSKKR
ncbi:sulfatase [Planctomycetes bacterium K23_9]|uniref:Arylsulfatase n=1 Tax=Stieleria marina TaxID=1930275 RepID=A0A517NTL1_9BACT|nr:Arylsulfatase [Planctomycetes bacterium K23_9]